MALPRSKYVLEGEEGVYHCLSRCVRRAFLCGFDTLTHRDYSHRKAWLVDRLRYLATIFAIEVCAYAVMENHYHALLRTRPDIVAIWSDWEVATRWLTLCPRQRTVSGESIAPDEKEIRALADCPERIAELRRRLSSLSWFMGQLNEFMARAANKEDQVKGRFWESRFKCQALLDEAAIAACMVYVDLNAIRAGQAATPEESDFTSIQERIRLWKKETMAKTTECCGTASQGMQSASESSATAISANETEIAASVPGSISDTSDLLDGIADPGCWLCPIQSDAERRGILQMAAAEYFDLVDRSGRMLREGKRGVIDADLAPILLRIGANPDAWSETIACFGSRFRVAAGLLFNLRRFADRLGRHWLVGTAAARAAFMPTAPQLV